MKISDWHETIIIVGSSVISVCIVYLILQPHGFWEKAVTLFILLFVWIMSLKISMDVIKIIQE